MGMERGGSAHTAPSTPDRTPTEPSRRGAPEAERKHEDTSASPQRKASPARPPLGRADDVSQPRSIPPNNPTPRPTRPWGLRRGRREEDGVWRQCSHHP